MMQRHGINFEVVCNKETVLAKVRENRQKHAQMVQEAREGYRARAMVALQKRLAQLSDGKTVGLSFQLSVPRDCTAAYDTAIAMLAAHEELVVTLKPEEFRHLMLDQWDWTDDFALVNAAYSPTTRAWGAQQGIEAVEGSS